MNGIHFAHPHFLWCAAAVPLLSLLLVRAEKMRRAALDRLIAARLQPRLAGSVSVSRRRRAFALLLAGIALALVALARPQMGFVWEEKKMRGRDIIIAMDTSNSMLANDLPPSRLARAKLAAEDLLGRVQGDRVGLLAFAGSSFLQAPLTPDFAAVRDSLRELDTEIIPRGGTNLADAIAAAAEAFGKGESDTRALIIFSDGEELEADAVASARANRDRFRIFTVGLGSPEGSLVPVPTRGGGTEFLKDDQGQYVRTKVDERRMREVAEASGGFYVHLQNGPAEMEQIVRDGLAKMKEHESEAQMSKVPIERYQWPLGAAFVSIAAGLLLGDRRRGRTPKAAVAAMFLLAAPHAQAGNTGVEKYQAKDYAGALSDFDGELKKRDLTELHLGAGAAAYQLGDYARAADSFSKALGTAAPELKSRAAYNLANTLARRGAKREKKEEKLGDLRDAVKQYDAVLRTEPRHEDAKHNRELVSKLIDDLEKEQKQQQQDKNDQQKDNKNDKQDQQKNDQQNPSQGGQDQKNQKDQQDSSQKNDGDKNQKDDKEQHGEQKQQPKDGGDGGKQKDSEDKKDAQQQDAKDGSGEKKQGSQQQNPDDKQGDEKQPGPQPKDGGGDKKKSGEVKAMNPGQQEAGKEDPAAEAEEVARAAQEGRMTEKDASQILEALKRVDRRVRLLDPKDEPQKNPGRPFKNW